MRITIHQPEHLPWLGFFDKLSQVDIWVILDHVQYRKNYYQNRNKIRSDNGTIWLTVPVLTKGNLTQSINEVQINNQGSPRWKEKCLASITQNYRKTTYWENHESFIREVYSREWTRLIDMNEFIIRYLLAAFSINITIIKSSELDVEGHREELILNICKKLGADVYISGVSGRDYINLDEFDKAGIDVHFQEFYHPIYKQLYEPFIPCLSAIDLLLNYGPISPDVIRGIDVETMNCIFK